MTSNDTNGVYIDGPEGSRGSFVHAGIAFRRKRVRWKIAIAITITTGNGSCQFHAEDNLRLGLEFLVD